MSIPRKISVCCPKCHSTFPVTIWDSVNTNLSKDLSQKIISGAFFDAKCPKCGFVAHLEYDLLYHDMEHTAFIWVVHKDNDKYKEKLQEICDSQASAFKPSPGYIVRVVDDMNQLREKAAALDAGRDDRIIELCKILLAASIKDQNPDFIATHLFYTYQGEKEIMYCYDTNENELHCYLDDDYYKKVERMFAKAFEQMAEVFPPVYDAAWAKCFFNSAEIDDVSAISNNSFCADPYNEVDNQLAQIISELQELDKKLKLGWADSIIEQESADSGMTPQQYKVFLRLQYQNKQYQYNQIIDQHGLAGIKEKQIIDNFDERKSTYSILEKVEIDLRKRIRESSRWSGCKQIAESAEYTFFCCDGVMLRQDKTSGVVVFFGKGSTTACVHNGWLYWYEWGSILSDKYICRRSLDGKSAERLDWLSNKKTMEVMGHSAHEVSEDKVVDIISDGETLIVEVQRISEGGGKYRLLATDISGELKVAREIVEGEMRGLIPDTPRHISWQENNSTDANGSTRKEKKITFQDFLKKYRKDN